MYDTCDWRTIVVRYAWFWFRTTVVRNTLVEIRKIGEVLG